MSKLFFNTEYRALSSVADYMKMVDYFNRDDRADKTLLEQEQNQKEDPEDMFSYYFYRKGSSGGFDFNGDKSYEDIMEEYQTYRPNYIWRSIITFTKEDAIDFGLKSKKDFASVTRRVVVKMAQIKNIPLKDVCWAGFYHTNTDNPHVHFYFYDRRNPLEHNLFSKKDITNIKATIAREVIDRTLLLKDKEDASRKLLLDTRKILNDEILLKNLENYQVKRSFDSSMFIHPKYKLKKNFFDQLLHLNEILPSDGRLSYNSYVLNPYRNEIDKMIAIILNNDALKDDFRIYCNHLEKVHQSNEELYGAGVRQNDYINDQTKRIYSSVGNAILKMIKSFRASCEVDPNLRYINYFPSGELKKQYSKMIKPYGHDLMKYSISSLCHEISLPKRMSKVRERSQMQMLKQIRKEQRQKENEEKEEVEHAS